MRLLLLGLAGLLWPTTGPAAASMQELLDRLQVEVLPVRTNIDRSVDYLRRLSPPTVRFRSADRLSPGEARGLLPALVVDDPDTGLNIGSSHPSAAAAAEKEESAPAPSPEPAPDQPNEPAEPATLRLRSVKKPPTLLAPLAPVVESPPPKVTVVESPPPLMQIYSEKRRQRERQLRNLVPYFTVGTNDSTNSGPIGLTNSLVPFAPPIFAP